ncbi:MAG: glycine cleavage system aminomethyltransferase GcvT [Bacillota bacterium]
MTEARKTALYGCHEKYGGKIVEFAGWLVSVQFGGILDEHRAVREAAGMFDVSYMGEFFVTGEDSLALIQKAVTNDMNNMVDGQVRYSPMCNDEGGTVDDLMVYRFSPDRYMLVVNGANVEKDFAWLSRIASEFPRATLTNASDDWAEIALQGPASETILKKLTQTDLNGIRYYYFVPRAEVAGVNCILSRTGYTGEDGFELYCAPEDAVALWDALMEAGEDEGLVPAGLGARDTLRFEACMPLYGQELSETTGPLEAGLGRFVSFTKGEFVGRDALLRMKEQGIPKKLVGFEMLERGIPRTHYTIVRDGTTIGEVTTGSFAPTIGKNLGIGYVTPDTESIGADIGVMIRGKQLLARTIKMPFYKRRAK